MSIVKWNSLSTNQPQFGFTTAVGAVPCNPKKKEDEPKLRSISCRSSCREAINYQIRSSIRDISYRKENPALWSSPLRKMFDIDLDLEQAHQPDVTKLWINLPADSSKLYKSRPRDFIKTTDAITGLTCLILNPNHYCGNWWRTPLPSSKESSSVFLWYGTDNFFLAHPAITSIVFGLLRQSTLLATKDLQQTLQSLAPRSEVRKALDDSDHERALYLVKRLKPLIVSSSRSCFFPIRESHFRFLFDLHRSSYKHGLKKVFGNITDAWKVKGGYWTVPKGSYSYFGERASTRAAQKIKEMV